MTFVAAIGWEIWFNYGLLSGMSVEKRRPSQLNAAIPLHINWLSNSLCDGSICFVGILLLQIVETRKALPLGWSRKGFITVLMWFLGQNILWRQ